MRRCQTVRVCQESLDKVQGSGSASRTAGKSLPEGLPSRSGITTAGRLRRRTWRAGLLRLAAGILGAGLLSGSCGGGDNSGSVKVETRPPSAGAAASATVTPVTPTVAASPSPGTATPKATSGSTYTVKAGDTLWDLAQEWGVTVDAIIATNSLSTPDDLAIGQELKIP